jgi:hypothetical protein
VAGTYSQAAAEKAAVIGILHPHRPTLARTVCAHSASISPGKWRRVIRHHRATLEAGAVDRPHGFESCAFSALSPSSCLSLPNCAVSEFDTARETCGFEPSLDCRALSRASCRLSTFFFRLIFLLSNRDLFFIVIPVLDLRPYKPLPANAGWPPCDVMDITKAGLWLVCYTTG